MKTGIQLIAEERQRQIEVKGWSIENDIIEYKTGDLAIVAGLYALPNALRNVDDSFVGTPKDFPWDKRWWKPSPENRIRELQKAGALIAAEIDRLLHE